MISGLASRRTGRAGDIRVGWFFLVWLVVLAAAFALGDAIGLFPD